MISLLICEGCASQIYTNALNFLAVMLQAMLSVGNVAGIYYHNMSVKLHDAMMWLD